MLTNLRSHWSHGRWTDGGGGGVEAIRTKEQWVKANPNTTLETAVAAARVKQDLMPDLHAGGLVDRIGVDHIFPTLPTAVAAFCAEQHVVRPPAAT